MIQEVLTSNIAREALQLAGYARNTAAHTVTMACISSNQAVAQGANMIRSGLANIIVAGGVETMSDVPIRFSRKVRARLIASQKVKSPAGYLGLLKGLGLKDLAPELPGINEFSTNESMGRRYAWLFYICFSPFSGLFFFSIYWSIKLIIVWAFCFFRIDQ